MGKSLLYWGLATASFLTFAGLICAFGGLAALQQQANSLHYDEITDPAAQARVVTVYNSTFTAGLINPLPFHSNWQFEYQWFTLWYEFGICLLTVFLAVFPEYLLLVKPTALAFTSAALVLIFGNCNAVLFFKRSSTAGTIFSINRIEATLAGLIILGIANGLSIIFMGLLGAGSGMMEMEQYEREAAARRSAVPVGDQFRSPNAGGIRTDAAQLGTGKTVDV